MGVKGFLIAQYNINMPNFPNILRSGGLTMKVALVTLPKCLVWPTVTSLTPKWVFDIALV